MKSLTSIDEILHNQSEIRNTAQAFFDENTSFPLNIEGLHGSLFSLFTAEVCRSNHVKALQAAQYSASSKSSPSYKVFSSDLIIVVPTEADARDIAGDFAAIYEEAEVHIFPDWGTVPYRPAARGSVTFGKRAGVLSKLLSKKSSIQFHETPRIFIFTQRAFMSPLPSPEYLQKLSFKLNKGDKLDTTNIAQKLAAMGYTRVPKVNVRGEFSLRGEVLDIFLPCDEHASRVIFDFDEIESFKEFEADTQATVGTKKDLLIYPTKEVLWTPELIEKARVRLEEYQETAIKEDGAGTSEIAGSQGDFSVHLPLTETAQEYLKNLLTGLSVSGEAEGEEFLYQLLGDKPYSLLDYIDENTFVLFFNYDKQENARLTINREYNKLYRTSREEYPVLPPDMVLSDYGKLLENISKCILFRTLQKAEETESAEKHQISAEPARSFFGNINFMKEELTELQDAGWNIFIFTDNENQQLRIHEIFKDFVDIQDDGAVHPVVLIPKAISAGFRLPEAKLLVIQENEIFGRRQYVPKSVNKAKSKAIDTFVELNPGDYIVHVNWGIGLFHGIERVKAMGNERDYIKLEYADNEFAFVPIEQVNLVQRYIGNEGDKPRLDRIGSKSWESRKNKVKQAVEDIAQKLIDLYSRRQASVGFAFPKETEWQAAFEAAFPYEDTPDQITVTEEIKADMERPVPMDRLVCGDVGYGKTEIAMRAAFKAVMGGKQVAFLAPTTILAEQHYENCKNRFKNFPVKIERLSRFVATGEQKKILAKVAAGEVDILVGTHRIIQKDVNFKKLGLMIIDEEQRFGVKDKEKLKVMKNNIDCLTMSATPIPRTLHMSLLKIRDMSLLTTPPQNRQPIETVVDEFTDDRITQAIRREIERGGQVFYLHNRVESLQEIRRKVETLVPEVLVDVAHGQMTSTQLEEIFHRFKMGGFHVLIATTIIENGIDIPNVNTIIIDRADMYGVSQLYQLRGRVGRSDRQAYAYLLYPENKALSEVAMKRLQVISDFTELGSGFKIAMKDMEIRGAGNLLGRDQSGDVYSVGFDMYVRLLNDAVNRLALQKDYKEQTEVLMEMEYTGFIPDTYIINPQIKMEIYKKIAAVTDDAEFDAVLAELADRFGPIPEEVSSLLALAEIRIICRKLSIKSIKERQGEVAVEFQQVSNISIDKILKLIKDNPNSVRLNQKLPNVLFIKLGKIGLKEKSEFIREKLSQLA
ncbi:transcription-repair coupling factor [Treponema bryantii]|uniref:transcription-repair coupling factor n=1 Tax=Treponema bryantii TaxID=163 RepID=UPI002B2D2429|nr:transcription-repair-coupling factor [Treponema bryantii]